MENELKFDIDILTKEINNLIVENPLQKIAESCKIDLSEELKPPPVAMKVKSFDKMIPLFTKGNFSIIAGPPKSRKTGFISMMMATAITGEFQNFFNCPNKGLNLLFDTEQSKFKAQQIGKRICYLSNIKMPDNLLIYSLREHDPDRRLEIIESVIESHDNINFVAIDGIIDLAIDPILQAEQAQKIIQKLMIWTEKYNIHITCVLHYNKNSSTLLGHLGSFGQRKADAVIEITKSKDNDEVSIVTAIACREREFETFAFTVDEFNNPYILEDFEIKKNREVRDKPIKKVPFSILNIDENIQNKIINHVFKIQKEQSYTECWRNIKTSIAEIISFIGDNIAKDVVTTWIQNGKIIKSGKGKKTIYTKSGQRTIEV